MKKKLLGTIVAAVMMTVMSLNVLAAESVAANGVVNEVVSATDKSGRSVNVRMKDVSAEYQAAAGEIKNIEKVKEVLGDAFIEGMEVIDVREVYADGDVEFPLTITFKVPGVLKTTNVAVLQYVNGEWVIVSAVAGDGTITVTLDSLSMLAFVVDKNTSASSLTSPKTGEAPVAVIAGVVVLAAAAGAFMLRKKSL